MSPCYHQSRNTRPRWISTRLSSGAREKTERKQQNERRDQEKEEKAGKDEKDGKERESVTSTAVRDSSASILTDKGKPSDGKSKSFSKSKPKSKTKSTGGSKSQSEEEDRIQVRSHQRARKRAASRTRHRRRHQVQRVNAVNAKNLICKQRLCAPESAQSGPRLVPLRGRDASDGLWVRSSNVSGRSPPAGADSTRCGPPMGSGCSP